jgi:hypothetical protein
MSHDLETIESQKSSMKELAEDKQYKIGGMKMKTLMTILATSIIVTCQNPNAQQTDYGDINFTSAIVVVGDKLQKAFEDEAFAVVMKDTKRVTDSVVSENSRWLSEFAATRLQRE